MVNIEELKRIQHRYNYDVTDYEVKKANTYIELMEKERENATVPVAGDIVKYTDKYGIYYEFAHIDKVLENEANAFARNVLVPTAMLQRLKNKSASNISNHFGITLAAAQTRLNFFYEDNRINKQNGTSSRLYTIFYNFYYKKKCTTCGYFIISKSIKYCPICGNKTLQWGESEMKYPVKIKLDENSKAVCCPKCDNEEVSPDGNYCHICGTYLINECTNYDGNYLEGCGRLAASNARYCIYCGAPTTFLQNGILKPWDFKENYNTFMSLPDTLDSEDEPLPFN